MINEAEFTAFIVNRFLPEQEVKVTAQGKEFTGCHGTVVCQKDRLVYVRFGEVETAFIEDDLEGL